MNRLSFILLFIFCWSCNNATEESIILDTIPLGLAEFLNDEKIAFINTGNIENNYFFKNLVDIKTDSLRTNPELNSQLLAQLLQSKDSTFYVNLQNLKTINNLDFSYNKSSVDSLLNSEIAVYELGYSKPYFNNKHALYYIELIDPTHRVAGKGVIVQLKNINQEWQVEAVVDGWEMRHDQVNFFSKFE